MASKFPRNDTSEAFGFSRKSTFGRTWTENIAFPRAFTAALGIDMDNEDAWTRRLMDEYGENLKKGVEGDVPLPAGFAGESAFWRALFWSATFGVVMGFVGLGFLNVADRIPKEWVNNGDFDTASDGDFYAGKKTWILITGGAGLLVGITRWLFSYPDNMPGIFKEIGDYHVDPTYTPITVFISAISLAGGSSLGPEQAMGNLGGGLATFVTENIAEFESDYRKLVVLCGMSAALGALFPTPILGVLMIYELGNPPRAYMESVILLSCGACVSFLVYYSLMEYTYLERVETSDRLASNWEFEETQCFTGFVFGIVCGALCLTSLICVGIVKQVFARLKQRLESIGPNVGTILCPMIGGLIVGTIAWVCPLTVGDGNMVLAPTIRFGALRELSTHLLITSAFAKMLALAVSMNCGFVGGFVFPMITIGGFAGVVAYQQYDYLPFGMCVGCFLAGVPAGICPMPFTLIGIPIYLLYFGLYQTVPIFICAITSYTVVCGTGILKALVARGEANKEGAKDTASAAGRSSVPTNDPDASLREQLVQQHQDYRMSQYAQNPAKVQRKPTDF